MYYLQLFMGSWVKVEKNMRVRDILFYLKKIFLKKKKTEKKIELSYENSRKKC